ncbi:MAG: transcription antitermination factor NusB [Actinomycetia bacterium]|nr:transcription antitermination factor NusB [Actinomycetes bacterium]
MRTSAPDAPAGLALAPGERPPMPGAVKVRVLDDGTPHHHTARTKARKAALDALYQADLRGVDPLDVLEDAPRAIRSFTEEIVRGVRFHQDDIDARIARAVTGDWTLERMPGLDRALARIAVWELDYTDLRPSAAISEALGLADEYSTDESVAFLNGLLGAVAATVGRAGDAPGDADPAPEA